MSASKDYDSIKITMWTTGRNPSNKQVIKPNMNKRKSGKLGGKQTLEKHGKEHFRKIAKVAAEKRKLILNAFKIGDLDNPVTAQSVRDKLEQIDNG